MSELCKHKNTKGELCCAFTKHPSGYCKWHRKEPVEEAKE